MLKEMELGRDQAINTVHGSVSHKRHKATEKRKKRKIQRFGLEQIRLCREQAALRAFTHRGLTPLFSKTIFPLVTLAAIIRCDTESSM